MQILALFERFCGRQCRKVAVFRSQHEGKLTEKNLFKLHEFSRILVNLILNVNVGKAVQKICLVFHATDIGSYCVFEFVNGRFVEDFVSIASADIDPHRTLSVEDKLDGVRRFQKHRNSSFEQIVERINMMLHNWIERGFVIRPAHMSRCLDAHWSLYSCNNI